MKKFTLHKSGIPCLLLYVALGINGHAQTFTTLLDFNRPKDGAYPYYESLVQGRDGNYYGTTWQGGYLQCGGGGNQGCGTVFKVTANGVETTLHIFCTQTGCLDGGYPYGGLVLGTDGNFYGTTSFGGAGSAGTIFKITPQGELTTLYAFDTTNGASPTSALALAIDGNFYGTAELGGLNGQGTVFRITPAGSITTIHSFCGQPGCPDGALPAATLVEGTDGNLYGTTVQGGVGLGFGTIFKISLSGGFTTLYGFDGADGSAPHARLTQASDGDFYGTTETGGSKGGGTVFRMAPNGRVTTLHSFKKDEGGPSGGLIQSTDGNLYGTTSQGGNNGNVGTIYSIDSAGNLATLYNFGSGHGAWPFGGLLEATSGALYGTTYRGGAYDDGTLFSFTMGLGQFVTFVLPAGRIGQTGGLLGQGFTGTTSVSLNGAPMTFAVVSDTFIKATVPYGATTGYVTVATPTGTLTSNLPFHVIP